MYYIYMYVYIYICLYINVCMYVYRDEAACDLFLSDICHARVTQYYDGFTELYGTDVRRAMAGLTMSVVLWPA